MQIKTRVRKLCYYPLTHLLLSVIWACIMRSLAGGMYAPPVRVMMSSMSFVFFCGGADSGFSFSPSTSPPFLFSDSLTKRYVTLGYCFTYVDRNFKMWDGLWHPEVATCRWQNIKFQLITFNDGKRHILTYLETHTYLYLPILTVHVSELVF